MTAFNNNVDILQASLCKKARLSRDARFDGKFFTAVKTTGIFCRPICPATAPKEENVEYFRSAHEAINAGYRPCLRCHPDSAPGSPAWKGVDATLERAVRLIDDGALQDETLQALSERLGISDRYLRQLFDKYIGLSPKMYALNQQCLFAKKLLHQTNMPVNQIALASGFNSVRRFGDCFRAQMGLTPTQVRRELKTTTDGLKLKLYYRPPYDWGRMQAFFSRRCVSGMEWTDDDCYGRTFEWLGCEGSFTALHVRDKNRFDVTLQISELKKLRPIVGNIRRILDLDADVSLVEKSLTESYGSFIHFSPGIRLPGIWSVFEAGVRAILGQQVSVVAAHNLLRELVANLGREVGDKILFPTPSSMMECDFLFLKIPESRKQTLRNLAQHYFSHQSPDNLKLWLELKGIGPWTVDYARLRGLSDPDVYMGGDLGIKKIIDKMPSKFDPDLASPWRSYLTIQLWSLL